MILLYMYLPLHQENLEKNIGENNFFPHLISYLFIYIIFSKFVNDFKQFFLLEYSLWTVQSFLLFF